MFPSTCDYFKSSSGEIENPEYQSKASPVVALREVLIFTPVPIFTSFSLYTEFVVCVEGHFWHFYTKLNIMKLTYLSR